MPDKQAHTQVTTYMQDLQQRITAELAQCDGSRFTPRSWKSELGAGNGMLLEQGEVFERAAVSYSQVAAAQLPPAATTNRPELANLPYQAMGLSLIVHPQNPFVPTVHLNVRFFSTCAAKSQWWFGGGMDLTPAYGFIEDCVHFHTSCQVALAPHGNKLYSLFKRQCDDYFFLRHRCHMRGIGGVFFDDYNTGSFDAAFAMTRAIGDAFTGAYLPIVSKRRSADYGKRQRAHLLHRRGRYVEFNLVQDRGTLFGLQSGGNADAILVSMPPVASWDLHVAQRDLRDDEILETEFLQPRDWVSQAGGETGSAVATQS